MPLGGCISLLVLAILLMGLGAWAVRRDSDGVFIPLWVIAAILLLIACIVAAVNWWSFAPTMTRLAQTRAAIARLPCAATYSGSQIYGEALQWNKDRASLQLWNHRWLIDPFIPDGWDTVTTIVIPECPERR